MDESDFLHITFFGWFLFFDTEGGFIERDKLLEKILPRQIKQGGLAAMMDANK